MRRKKSHPIPADLSPNERAAMLYIEQYLTQRGRSPATREVAMSIGLSVSATHDLIQRLIERGYLARRSARRRARNLRVKRPLSG